MFDCDPLEHCVVLYFFSYRIVSTDKRIRVYTQAVMVDIRTERKKFLYSQKRSHCFLSFKALVLLCRRVLLFK